MKQLTDEEEAHTGKVKRYPPSEAQAKPVRSTDKAGRWLHVHRNDEPIKDPKEEQRQQRMANAKRERIRQRNTAVRKGLI